MAFEFSGNLPREQQPIRPALSFMERLEKMITERLKNMAASTKHSLFAGIMALAGVAMLPFIASSQKDEAAALHNLTTLLESLDGFKESTNRTPYRDVENYLAIALASKSCAPTAKKALEKAGGADYEELRRSVMKQSSESLDDIERESPSPYPEISPDQQGFIDYSRANPERTINTILFLAEEFEFPPSAVGLTPQREAALRRKNLQNQISSSH